MLVALIVFGPRKLPNIGRTIGKYTAEFKRASRDFRETWEREVQEAEISGKDATATNENVWANLENDFKPNPNGAENSIGRNAPWAKTSEPGNFAAPTTENDTIALPEIRAVESTDFHSLHNGNPTNPIAAEPEVAETAPNRKRDWL